MAELLNDACPSIQYRLRREVLNESPSQPEMLRLQDRIMRDEAVQVLIRGQQPDGWLGWSFHGDGGMEPGIRLLCEKGVDPHHPVLARSLGALAMHMDRLDRGIGKVGGILDDRLLGGSRMILATLLANAGIEDVADVRAQITIALEGFTSVCAVEAIGDVAEPYRGKLVFRPGVLWPSIYHLRLLAFTHSWRTTDSRRTIAESIKRLTQLSPIPEIYARHGSQLVAPASFAMHDFSPDVATMNAADWMPWFHRAELLSRLGVVPEIAALRRQVDALETTLDAASGRFTRPLTHDYFRRWGAYTGLMLEKDWRSPTRRVYDLTFRSLITLHYAATQRTTD